MKKLSWEIILAGFLFVGLSIYLIESNSQKKGKQEFKASSINSEKELYSIKKQMVLELKDLEQFNEDSLIREIEQLEDLEKLEKLKSILAFLPAEVKDDIQMNIDLTIDEIEKESSSLNIELRDGKLIVKPNVDKSGNQFWNMESAGVYSHTESFDASEINFADLEFPYGSVQVQGTDEKIAHIVITASGDFENADDLSDKLRPEINIENGKVLYRFSENPELQSSPNINLQTVVNVPRRMDIKTSTGGGHIELKNLAGDHQLSTDAGHITVSGVTGIVDAKTLGGHIKAFKTSGKANFYTAGGHISVTDSDCEATLRSDGGNLWITNVSGALKGDTKGGNVTIRQEEVTNDMITSTGAGNVELTIGENSSFNLDLQARGIELSPLFGLGISKAKGKFSGIVNGGGPLIKSSSGYGTVSLKKYE